MLNSRIHLLKSLSTISCQVYLKREDELSFGVSGFKLRKYESLIPYLCQNNIKLAAVIGGSHSNNVLGLSQRLLENNIKPWLFLRGEGQALLQGNYLLTRLLVNEKDIIWVNRKAWDKVEIIASDFLKNQADSMVIPEGAVIKPAFEGAKTLAADIIAHDIDFKHIFIDSGTGLSACAMLKGFQEQEYYPFVHIVNIAGNKTSFLKLCQDFNIKPYPNLEFYSPITAKSYGAVNQTLFQWIKTFAQTEGVLTDAIYSAKAIMTFENIIKNKELKGDILCIHSGGALSLLGFQENLHKVIM